MTAEENRKKILESVKEFVQKTHQPKPFQPGVSPVAISGRVYDANDVQMLVDASLDFWLTAGRFNQTFEKKLADFLNTKFVLTTNSGSSANLLAVASLTSPLLGERALRRGDEVVTTAVSFPTTINPLLLYGLVPVFVDIDLPTYNVCVDQIEKAITPRTRAVMLAHTLGNPFNIEDVLSIARKYRLWVIEDCCDALGSTYRGKSVGTYGDIGTLSFYPAHHITMGEGGAIFTNDPKLNRIIRSIRDWGRDCWCDPGKENTCGKRFEWKLGDLPSGHDHKYIFSHLGFNLKITDMQAAVGVAQLGHLPKFIEARHKNFSYLKERFNKLQDIFMLPEPTPQSNPSWFGFPITIREEAPFDRTTFIRHLYRQRIETRHIFAGNITRQPYFKDQIYRISGRLENTEAVMNRSFWLGVFPGLNEPMLDYVVQCIEKFLCEIEV